MIIILEGCDKTGKTTLAKEICSRLGYEYIKISNPEYDAYQEYITHLNNTNGPTLFDRFHLGELVYGPIFRNKNDLAGYKFSNIEKVLKGKGTKIIYTYNNVDWIKNKFIEDKETFVSENQIEDIIKAYNNVLYKTELPVIKYKIGDDIDKLIEELQ